MLPLLLALTLGCSGSQIAAHARIADAIGRSANAALPELVRAYRAEGDRAIDSAADRVVALEALAATRQHWSPVWGTCDAAHPAPCELGAWAGLRSALDAYAGTLEHVRDGSAPLAVAVALVGPLVRLWCAVAAYLPADSPAHIPALCPGGAQ